MNFAKVKSNEAIISQRLVNFKSLIGTLQTTGVVTISISGR
jgi:hypothetical protein